MRRSVVRFSIAAHLAFSALISSADASALLFYAKYGSEGDQEAIGNPSISGALFQIYWSEVEKQKGVCDWTALSAYIKPWTDAGKKVALRIMWSSSGYWADPAAQRPTPQWVWDSGAVKIIHAASGTEIPLFWDPVYLRNALEFLDQTATYFGSNPGILLLDITAGAETNPYRFGTINEQGPSFQDTFKATSASDGRTYSEALWVSTVKAFIDSAVERMHGIQPLVTLNTGCMPGEGNNLGEIGDYAVSRGCMVGQNGLRGSSYATPQTSPFYAWADQRQLFFEMVAATGGTTGTLREVMQAAERIRCCVLNVYPSDVLKGTQGYGQFDPAYEDALRYGDSIPCQAGTGVAGRGASSPEPAAGRAVFRLSVCTGSPGPAAALDLRLDFPVAARVSVFDPTGREVAVILNRTLGAGRHVCSLAWEGMHQAGGIHLVRVQAGRCREVVPVWLTK